MRADPLDHRGQDLVTQPVLSAALVDAECARCRHVTPDGRAVDRQPFDRPQRLARRQSRAPLTSDTGPLPESVAAPQIT
jgi:hypothetical protein